VRGVSHMSVTTDLQLEGRLSARLVMSGRWEKKEAADTIKARIRDVGAPKCLFRVQVVVRPKRRLTTVTYGTWRRKKRKTSSVGYLRETRSPSRTRHDLSKNKFSCLAISGDERTRKWFQKTRENASRGVIRKLIATLPLSFDVENRKQRRD